MKIKIKSIKESVIKSPTPSAFPDSNVIRSKSQPGETAFNPEELEEYLENKHQLILHKKLGAGQYGTVFSGFYNDKDVAVKILLKKDSKSRASADREARNYTKISKLRSKHKAIAKHFPKVYFVDELARYTIIVMEQLEVSGYYQEETLNNFFGWVNTKLSATQSEEDYSGEKFTNVSNRLYVYFSDKESLKTILSNFVKFMSGYTKENVSFLVNPIKIYLSNLKHFFSNVKIDDVKREIKKLPQFSQYAEDILYRNDKYKKEFSKSPWFLKMIVIQLQEIAEKYDAHNSKEGLKKWNKLHSRVLAYWINFYRKSSVIGFVGAEKGTKLATQLKLKGPDTGVGLDSWPLFKEAEGLKMAFLLLRRNGILATDMHRKNVMFRPGSEDLVIVDLGLFKELKK